MGKITETDIVTMALLYRKKYAGTDMLSYDSILRFGDAINKNLEEMGVVDRYDIKNDVCSNLYFILRDERGNSCAILNPNIDLNSLWLYHICCWSFEFCLAAEMDNAMKEINLIFVDNNFIDRTEYYNELRKKYNLLSEFERPKFDIFRNWDQIVTDGFVEKFCLSKEEQNILNELRQAREQNEQKINDQLNVLKRTKRSAN